MARQLILKISCARCDTDIPEDDPAYDQPVLLRYERREGKLDLCAKCSDDVREILAPLLDQLDERPVTPPPVNATSSSKGGSDRITGTVCPDCGTSVGGATSSLRSHLINLHGYSKNDTTKRFPNGAAGIPYEEQFPELARYILREG